MRRYITLDLGTTKSKISLVTDGRITDSVRISNSAATDFMSVIRDGIIGILHKNSLTETEIAAILATGTMATAEMGIYPIDHLTAPVGIDELHGGAVSAAIPSISDIPFFIVRGVKTSRACPEDTDMMRGEESEIMGIPCSGEGVYMLMGSHTKIVRTDSDGRITDIRTLLTGELISAAVSSTILKHSVSLESSSIEPQYLKRGCEYALKNSISEALFKVRVLKNNFAVSDSEAYSFFIGALLSPEIAYVKASGAPTVTVCGNKHLKDAAVLLLSEYSQAEVRSISDSMSEDAVSLGLVRIFEWGK